MIIDTLAKISVAAIVSVSSQFVTPQVQEQIISSHEISLEKRYYPVQKDNILLNLAYMDGRVTKKEDISWDELQKPFKFYASTYQSPKHVLQVHPCIPCIS